MNRLAVLIIGIVSCSHAFSQDYNILNYGAVQNTNSTKAIQKAIDACASAHGGRVVIPSGTFITGPLFLKSFVNLHLEQGAVLRGSTNVADYEMDSITYGMIYCIDAEQVSITGSGTIDGQGTTFYDAAKNHIYPEFDKNLTRQKQQYMPEGTFFSDGPLERKESPGMTIVFWHCDRIFLDGIEVKDTPIWAIRFAYCEDVVVNHITIRNNPLVPNNDGIHSTTSRNVRISDCDIQAGDDAIAITGFSRIEDTPGYDTKEQDAYVHGNKSMYAENFQVSNCHLQSRSCGIRIGYGQHPIRRCTFENISIYGSNRGIGIFAHDAADISELIFSNITIETRLFNGQWWGNGEPVHLSCISRFDSEKAGRIMHVQFNHIIATGEEGMLFYGRADSHLEDIRLNDITLMVNEGKETFTYGGNFDLRPSAIKSERLFTHDIPGIYIQYADGFRIRDFKFIWGKDMAPFFSSAIQAEHVTAFSNEGFEGNANTYSVTKKEFDFQDVAFLKALPNSEGH